jgi:hypothetical protein
LLVASWDEQAFFSWLAEPVLRQGGSPNLLHHEQADSKSGRKKCA